MRSFYYELPGPSFRSRQRRPFTNSPGFYARACTAHRTGFQRGPPKHPSWERSIRRGKRERGCHTPTRDILRSNFSCNFTQARRGLPPRAALDPVMAARVLPFICAKLPAAAAAAAVRRGQEFSPGVTNGISTFPAAPGIPLRYLNNISYVFRRRCD